MRIKSLAIILVPIFVLGMVNEANAQRSGKFRKTRQSSKKISGYAGDIRRSDEFRPYQFIGFSINGLNYFGDLAPINEATSISTSLTRFGFGFHGGYKFHHYLAVRGGLNYGRLYGDDIAADIGDQNGSRRYDRNLSFRNDIKEFQIGLEIYLLPNYGGANRRLPFNAYLFLGGAVFHHEPKAKVPDADYQTDLTGATLVPRAIHWVKLRPLGTEGQKLDGSEVAPYGNIQFSIPIAIGAQISIPRSNFTVGIEFGLRYLFFDYIDDVSGNYVDLDRFDNDLARILSDRSVEQVGVVSKTTRSPINAIPQTFSSGETYNISGHTGSGRNDAARGNPDNNDMFLMTQFKLTYVIGPTSRRAGKFR